MIMATFTGAPAGGFIGGQIVAVLLPHFDWPIIFMIGGVFPLILVVALAIWLPESPRFLARQAEPGAASRQPCSQRLNIAPAQERTGRRRARQSGRDAVQPGLRAADRAAVDHLLLQPDEPVPVRLLDADGAEPDRHDAGRRRCSPRACGTSARCSPCCISAWRSTAIGPERTLALHYALGAVFIAVIALVALPYALLLLVSFVAGMTIIGSQTGANGTCGKLYPARMRTSGLGWALGIGRLGGIAAPALGG